MKNKGLVWLLSVLGIIAVVAFVFIVSQLWKKPEEITPTPVENTEVNSTVEENNKGEKMENVVLTSKHGVAITELTTFPNIYSDAFVKQINDAGKLTDTAKRLFTFVKMTTDSQYENQLKELDQYRGMYVTGKDLATTAATLFANTDTLKQGEVGISGIYEASTGNYVQLAQGFVENEFDYVIELPISIQENSTQAELLKYRFYVRKFTDAGQNESYDVVYYDRNRTKEAVKIQEEAFEDPVTQETILQQKLKSKEISSSMLEQVKYTLQRQQDTYKIEQIAVVSGK